MPDLGGDPSVTLLESSDVERILVCQISKQLLLICARRQPRAYAFDLAIIICAESRNIDLLEALLSRLFLCFVLPERGEHRVQIIMEVMLTQSLPLIPVKPDASATFAMIDRKTETMSD